MSATLFALTLAIAMAVGFTGTWLALKVRDDIRRKVRDAYTAGIICGLESANQRWAKK